MIFKSAMEDFIEYAIGLPGLVDEAREWVADCTWGETEDDPSNSFVYQIQPQRLLKLINQHFDGGLREFVKNYKAYHGAKMSNKNLLTKLAEVANDLDKLGLYQEANRTTQLMYRLSQFKPPMTPGTMSGAAISEAFNRASTAVDSGISGIGQIADGIHNAGIGVLEGLGAILLAPFDVVKQGADAGVQQIMAPYEAQMRSQQAQIDQLIGQLTALKQNPQALQAKAKEIQPQLNALLSQTQRNVKMLQQRIMAGQMSEPGENNDLMQQYVNWGAGKTVNDVYQHALQSNSANFANNLMAILKARGLSQGTSVIPQGYQLFQQGGPPPANNPNGDF